MRIILRLVLFVALAVSARPALADDSTAAFDPLLAPQSGTPSPSLATPVENAPDAKADALTAPPPAPAAAAIPTPPPTPPSGSEERAATTSTEETNANAQAKAPPAHDEYEDYRRYLEQEKERKEEEKGLHQHQSFAHENGSWDFSILYARNAFPSYNFAHGTTQAPQFPSTQGGILTLEYYPFRSLSMGRLGLVLNGGAFFSKFSLPSPTGGLSYKNVHSIDSGGLRIAYEFDYWISQLIVPHIFIGYDRVNVHAFSKDSYQVNTAGNQIPGTNTGVAYPSNQFSTESYGGGLYLNLNRAEPIVATRAYVSTGIKKFYLAYTAMEHTGATSGLTHFLGLRFEF